MFDFQVLYTPFFDPTIPGLSSAKAGSIRGVLIASDGSFTEELCYTSLPRDNSVNFKL